ncbi:FHA domain-containing protein, partial [bacterium]|nr:FHA domain-containing protein [bacterium]
IEVGMVLAEDLRTKTGLLLLARMQKISDPLRTRVLNYAEAGNIAEPIKILVSVSKDMNSSAREGKTETVSANSPEEKTCPSCSHRYVFRRFQNYFCTQCGSELDRKPNRARLCVLDGQLSGAVFFLKKGRHNSIGRDPGNAIVLSDEQISRKHATIIYEKDNCWIEDHGINGVYLNGKKIEREQLHHGSVIKLGNTILRFDDNQPSP